MRNAPFNLPSVRRPSLGFLVLATFSAAFLFAPRTVNAADENSALAEFHRAVEQADSARAEDEFKKTHPKPPSKQEAQKLVATLTHAAIDVMDRAGEFEKQFPQSIHLAEVRTARTETLTSIFGSQGLPVPKNRAADLEACTRRLLHDAPDDVRLYMVLCRVAGALPIAQQHAIYEELSRESTPGPARAMAQNALRKLERVGLPLNFDFTALDGRHVSLAELKGKVVLIDFWATTCAPCVAELPDLKQLYAKYQPTGLEIIGISLDPDKAVLTHFIEKEKIPWPQYYDPAGATNRLATTYGITSIPVVWLVDRHGLLRHLNARENQEKKIQSLLAEPP